MKTKNAFVVYVFGSYEKYIPYYVYFINLNYPEDDILIFYQDRISDNIKIALKKVKNYKLFENVYPEHKNIGGGGPKLLRWVLPEAYFKNYQYVYIGDVDILMLKEEENLFKFHIKQASKFNLPFSNRVRPLPQGGLSKRLTGLHFFEVKPYYKKIGIIADKILNDEEFSKAYLLGLERNEHVLYKLVKDTIGFDENVVVNMKRPWHGFHIGVVRGGLKMSKENINENSSIPFDDIKSQLALELDNKKFIKLFKDSFCIEVYWSFLQFDIKLPFEIQIQYFKYKIKVLKSKSINKIRKLFRFFKIA